MNNKIVLLIPLLAVASCQSNGQQKARSKLISPERVPTAQEQIRQIPEKSYPNLPAGSLAPDVFKIDADEICTIINGAVLVKKGDAEALIDINGKFIIPWNKYTISNECLDVKPNVALFAVGDKASGLVGYVNTQGKIVIPCIYQSLDKFDCFKLATALNSNSKNIVVNAKGQVLPPVNTTGLSIGMTNERINENQLSELILNSKSNKEYTSHLYGYATSAGIQKIPFQYEQARQFSDGLAAVMQIDQFGEKKWGFINTQGKLVIPYTFTIEPGDFHEGLALVMPKRGADFD